MPSELCIACKVTLVMIYHFGTGKPLSTPGGTHSVVLGLAKAQERLGTKVVLVDQIKLFGQKYKSNVEISSQRDLHYVNEFHFCLSYLHVLLRNPLLVIRSNLNILHFHGPWYLESKIQNPKAHIRNFVKFVLEVILVHSFPRIICVSRAFADLLTEKYLVSAKKISVIPAGIDTNRFYPSPIRHQNERSASPLQIGTVRRLVPRMGLDFLITSMIEIENSFLTIAGTGPMHEQLNLLVKELNLEDKVKLIGFVPEKMLPRFYQNLDLCIIPSIALEGFCITALEAMACGTPVIASDLDGLKESVGNCDSRLLFKANSQSALVEKVEYARKNVVGNQKKFREYSLGYSWDSIALRLDNVIQLDLNKDVTG